MAGLTIEQFGDLLTTTLSHHETPDYTSLITDLTDFPAAKQLIKRNSMSIQSGKDFRWLVDMEAGNAFEFISFTDHDQVNLVDGTVEAVVPWRKAKTAYMFYAEEMTMNRPPARLIDLIKKRENNAMAKKIEGMERAFWRFTPATDTKTFLGLPNWCYKNATTGFNGGAPTGYTTVAGLSPTTYPRWNNYTAQYTLPITSDDFILKARTMATETDFKNPVDAIPDKGKVGRRAYYTTLTVVQQLENFLDTRNDNRGNDIDTANGQVTFRRVPVIRVPALDEDTTNPFYQMDWGVFKMLIHTGWWDKRTVLAPYPGQRNVSAVFLDSILNTACFSRRNLGVMATGTTYP